MLAGSKRQLERGYQGISFFSPFFFLLVDSSLVSTGGGFTAAGALSADCAAGCVDAAAGAAAGAAVSGAVPEALEALLEELEELASAAGGLAVPEPFRPASTVPLAAAGGGAAVRGALVSGAGVVVAGCSEVGWPLSSSGVRISAPTPAPDAAEPTGAVVASSGVTTSVLLPDDCVLAPAALPVRVNEGPAAPGRSTSVAETASFGGAICGVPPRAAVETSGLPLSIPSGSFTTMLW